MPTAMLLSLTVKDFVIVERLSLDFASGFTVLTGETGAGKSIILDALGLALGDRSEGAQVVREGCDRADISARFSFAERADIAAWLTDNELAGDEDQLLLRRLIDKSGRSKSMINGQQATLAQLRHLGDLLVDIHGQQAHQSLVRPDTQRQLLDAFAGDDPLVHQVAHAWQRWQSARHAFLDAQRNADVAQLERERLEWQIGELAPLQMREDEWNELGQNHDRLSHAAELVQSAQMAVESLSEMDGSCLSVLSTVQTRLARLSHLDPRLAESLALLESVEVELSEAVHGLRDYAGHLDEDPAGLQEVERRLESLMSMARKFRCQPQELPGRLSEWQRQLGELDAATDLEALAEANRQGESDYRALAEQLSAVRLKAAGKLSHRIGAEMQQLAMAGARFEIGLCPLDTPSAHGLESIEYRVATNSGTRLQPLAKVASGGELSRISLAMQVAISQVASVPTLIFDEVDVGIGGRVAEVVGKKLQALGRRYQVLCVTHLAQVASCGDQHWQVSKKAHGAEVISQITVLNEEARVQEIARMLGGAAITETTRHHAAEMLTLNAAGAAP
jgi:DNA repair protein RecN (Recombination protein N)